MPSFMSKHLSTGAEAAYGQPFAFTTGVDGPKGASGAKPTSGQDKKKAKAKKRRETLKDKRKAEAAKKPPHEPKHRKPLTPEDKDTMKQIGKTHTEARYSAFHSSLDIPALNAALRAANAAALQGKVDILQDYYVTEAGAENAKLRRLRKDVAYFELPPTHTDSRVFLPLVFDAFKAIYVAFYSAEISLMNLGTTGAEFQVQMKDIVDKKKRALEDFYDKHPALRPKQRTPVPNLTPVSNVTPKQRKPKPRSANAAAAGAAPVPA